MSVIRRLCGRRLTTHYHSTRRAAIAAIVFTSIAAAAACRERSVADPVKPVYSKETGVLQELLFDSNKDGKTDTRTFMNGNRPVRSEIDPDQNGVTDRWEYYAPDGKLQRVGTSSANDGKEDTWMFPAADGGVARVENATRRDGKVNHIEYWERGAVARIEEDSNTDGRIDRWETYSNGALASVALDTTLKNGRPDRRLIYGPGGDVDRVEVDPDGDGIFTPAQTPKRQ